ncbi:hypothetical protein [Flavobacterium chungangensis]|uniref:Restriction endonuclease n=1 Tax=Flavobacterium chungangensis TaxID=2708132 RepID=A0ABV8ZE70_9FLAO
MLEQFKTTDTPLYRSNKIFGDYYEAEAITYIEDLFSIALQKSGRYLKFICDNKAEDVAVLKGWDLKFGIFNNDDKLLKTITFEIKTDKAKTPNVFFERTCKGTDSGVFASKADYFFYWLPLYKYDNVFIIKPGDLVQLIREKQYHLSLNCGEGGRVSGHLRLKDDFVDDIKEYGGKVYSYDVYVPEYFGLHKVNEFVKYEFKEVDGVLSYNEIKGRA